MCQQEPPPRRVLIVGAGIAGALTAIGIIDELERLEAHTTSTRIEVDVVEEAAGPGHGASFGGASLMLFDNIHKTPLTLLSAALQGVVRPAHGSRLRHWLRFLLLGVRLATSRLRKLAVGLPAAAPLSKADCREALSAVLARHGERLGPHVHRGALFVVRSARLWDELRRAQPGGGYELLDAAAARALEPSLALEEPLLGAALSRRDGWCDCEALLPALAALATDRGASFEYGVRVERLRAAGGAVACSLRRGGGAGAGGEAGGAVEREYDAAVVCSGAVLDELLPGACVRGVAGFSLRTPSGKAPPAPPPRLALVFPEQACSPARGVVHRAPPLNLLGTFLQAMFCRPEASGGYRVGGLMSLDPAAVESRAFNPRALAHFRRTALGAALASSEHVAWTGVRPVAAETPIARRLALRGRVWGNGAYGGNGFVWAWGASERVAREVVAALLGKEGGGDGAPGSRGGGGGAGVVDGRE